MKKLSDNVSPLVSIITVAFNAVNEIESTILSVLSQSYNNIEFIVVDGGSTDGTIDIINKYSDKIDFWISEPDKGVYDAMNKGIKMAHGEWVNFMNCGDAFYQTTIIESVVAYMKMNKCDVVYGDVMLNVNGCLILKKADVLRCIKKTLPFCHQSSFVKMAILRDNMFDLSYRIAADYALFYKLYSCNKYIFAYHEEAISIYEATSGISSMNRRKAYKEINSINKCNQSFFGKIKYYMVYFLLFIKVLK